MLKDIPTSRDLTHNIETQDAVRRILTQWAGELSNQRGLQFGDQVNLKSITSRPVFFGKLETLYEARRAYEKEAPLAHNEHLTPQMIYQLSQVDPWALHVADHREFSPFKRDYVVPGSSVLVPCPTCHGDEESCARCHGTKMIDCPDCGGEGLSACPSCGNSGQKVCPDCDAKGFLFCPACSGSGTTTRQETELSDDGVLENIKNISQPCVKCGGSGKVECRKCNASGFVQCTTCNGKKYTSCASCRGTGKTFCPECRELEPTCTTCHGGGKVKRQFVVRQEFLPQVERVIDVDDDLDIFRRFYESLGKAHATLLMEHVDTSLSQDLLVETPLDEWYTATLSAMNSGDHVEADGDVRIKLQSIELAYIVALEVVFTFEEREYTYLIRMDTEKVFIQQNPEERERARAQALEEERLAAAELAAQQATQAGGADGVQGEISESFGEDGTSPEELAIAQQMGLVPPEKVVSSGGEDFASSSEKGGSEESEYLSASSFGENSSEQEESAAAKGGVIPSSIAQIWTGKIATSLLGTLLFLLLFRKPLFILPFVRESYMDAVWAQMAYPWILVIITLFWILLGKGSLARFPEEATNYKPLTFELSRGSIIIAITAVVSSTGLLYGLVRLLYGFVQLFV